MANKKSSKKLNKNDIIMKEFTVNQIGMLAQAIFILFSIVFGIATIFEGEILVLFEMTMGLTLLTMAYNNVKMFKRAVFTIPYLLGAAVAFFSAFEILLGL